MRLVAEIQTNPGPQALFVAGVQISTSEAPHPGYKSLELAWWLLKDWKSWLWDFEWDPGDGWSLYRLRILGFEVTWEHKGKEYD